MSNVHNASTAPPKKEPSPDPDPAGQTPEPSTDSPTDPTEQATDQADKGTGQLPPEDGSTKSQELYRPPSARALDWIQDNAEDPRSAVIKERLASVPQAAWFAEYKPEQIASEVRTITSDAASKKQIPVLVAYTIPDRDCGGYSKGGAPNLPAYETWITRFASGLGDSEVIVILEPDAIALSECLPEDDRQARYDALSAAVQTLKKSNPKARVYMDAGHSGWHPAERQAEALRAAGAAQSDGIFSNVSNFHRTSDETDYARRVLDAIGDKGLGAVIDTSRNGNGAPESGQWCDPAGRALGQRPTLTTGEERIDAYLWIKLPGESDGCQAAPGEFLPDYALALAGGARP